MQKLETNFTEGSSKPKVILFNGAASCGKGEAIKHLVANGYNFPTVSCKDHLHKLTMDFFCIPSGKYFSVYEDRYAKEIPSRLFRIHLDLVDGLKLDDLLGYNVGFKLDPFLAHRDKDGNNLNLSVREAMIYISEVIMKPRMGKDYFGKARVALLPNSEVVFDDSCGFVEELPPLIEGVGQENLLLIRVHRKGFDFTGDSRVLIPHGVINHTVDVFNHTDINSYLENVREVVDNFLDAHE